MAHKKANVVKAVESTMYLVVRDQYTHHVFSLTQTHSFLIATKKFSCWHQLWILFESTLNCLATVSLESFSTTSMAGSVVAMV